MRGAAVVATLCLAACGGAAAHPSAPTSSAPGATTSPANGAVRFTKKRPRVGDVTNVKERNESHLALEIYAGASVQHGTDDSVQTIERRTEILALEDDGMTKQLRVTYTTNRKEETGKDVAISPVEGKTYVLEGHHGASAPDVLDASGAPAPPAEAKELLGSYAHLGHGDAFFASLPERPLSPGEWMPDMAKALLDESMDDGLERVSVRFRGGDEVAGAPVGVFDLELTGKLQGDHVSTVRGVAALFVASAWEAWSDMEAPIDAEQKGVKDGKPFTVMAHGTMHLHKEETYETP